VTKRRALSTLMVLSAGWPCLATADDAAAALAKKLSNPVAALISVPFQLNYDDDVGAADTGDRWTLNVQPVVPISLSEDWNLISRTIVPLVSQREVFAGAGSQSGLGDIVQSVFFSPKAPTSGGVIWGVGPALLAPTGTDDLLTADQWAAGPTGVVLRQEGRWTVGALANHLWSLGGSGGRPDIDATFVQPFVSYGTPTGWTFGANLESTYDWTGSQWTVPVNVSASKVTRLGGQLVSVGGGLKYWVDGAPAAPEGLAFRASVTLLFPK
jgi:hypothetical protein